MCRETHGRKLRVGGAQLDFRAEAEEAFEGCARRIHERDDNLSVARDGTILYERDVAVADVLVNHRIADHPQGVHIFGPHAAQQKTWN